MTLPSWAFPPSLIAWAVVALTWIGAAVSLLIQRARKPKKRIDRDHSEIFNGELAPETRDKLKARFLKEMRKR